MPAGKKLILTAAGVVVLGAGGYVGAQAVVGNEVEKALSQTFAQLDESFSWYANDVTQITVHDHSDRNHRHGRC